MTDLVALRKEAKSAGFSLSFNDFVLKACALSLVEFPTVNSATDDGVNLAWSSQVNIGVAVSIDSGLVVPVLREADKMSMDELHDVARELADKAREGKLVPDEMQGGTFTVSNMGMLNVEEFSAIINPGESAILAVSSIIPTAVVDDNRQVVVRDMMKITLSADHRVVDGALAAMFANAVKRRLENTVAWRELIGL
jgi:pyruvate dehydrogenase E2 component (dihydrolipoamide acetyltransferase)